MIVLQQTRGVLFKPNGVAGPDFGDLVVELLFEDGAGSATAANTGTIGGTFAVTSGAGPVAFITTTDSFQGSGSLGFPNILNPRGCVSYAADPRLVIGTANFKISVYVKLTTFTTSFGQFLWGWQPNTGDPQPTLIVGTDGLLYFHDGTTSTSTGVTPDLSVWREYRIERISGTTDVYYNGASVMSFADTTNYNPSFSSGNFQPASNGDFSGCIRNGFMDQFQFYNGNA